MDVQPHLPMIVQSDRTILLEVQNPLFAQARQALSGFAELVKSPEFIHTYRITPISLWNAAAGGLTADDVLSGLARFSKFGVPPTLAAEIRETMGRYGLIRLEKREDELVLTSTDPLVIEELASYPSLRAYLTPRSAGEFTISAYTRGIIKQELIKLGYPVQDLAGYETGEACPIQLKTTVNGLPFRLRDYQQAAVDAFYADGTVHGGSGVLVLPCGAGKTVIGLGVIAQIQAATLILTTNTTSVRQWRRELLEKTGIDPDWVGEYTGDVKEVKPVTITTYQMLTYRRSADGEYPHLKLFHQRNWGLLIYDEVHLLPAPVFRMTASLQATRRLGLTATLVREDHREDDVFALVGPKKYEMPWKELADEGWIAEALCREIRVTLEPGLRESYAVASPREKYRIAAENPRKLAVIQKLLERHKDDHVLIIGQYVHQLETVAKAIDAPIITGKVAEREREHLYEQFKTGAIKRLVVSKVANFAIDLPDANVAIQISGTFGSRQEEAQRLGRILRPKEQANRAYFYTLVTRQTREQEFAARRQLFLVEQGYRYDIVEDETPNANPTSD